MGSNYLIIVDRYSNWPIVQKATDGPKGLVKSPREAFVTEHIKVLPELAVADNVRIQNQVGPKPLKWDKTGRVVEVHQHDQYVIKVD